MATALIETPDELDAYFADLMDANERAIARGMERGLKAGADEIRKDAPPSPPREWNLRAGIGVDERWPRQKGPIPGLASRQDYHVKEDSDGVSGYIASAMTYHKHIVRRGNDFWSPGIARTPAHIQREVEIELAKVDGELR